MTKASTAEEEQLWDGLKASEKCLRKLGEEMAAKLQQLKEAQKIYQESLNEKVIDFEKTLMLEVKIKVASKGVLDLKPALTDAIFSSKENWGHYKEKTTQMQEKILDMEVKSIATV